LIRTCSPARRTLPLTAGGGVDQLGVDPHLLARPPHAALQHVAHAQVLGDLPHLHRLALVGEDRVAGDHEEARDLRQVRDQVLGHAVGEVLLVRVVGHVGEGQDGDRGLVGQRMGHAREGCGLDAGHPGPLPDHQTRNRDQRGGGAGKDRFSPTDPSFGCGARLLPGLDMDQGPVDHHRLADVLDLMFAKILEPDVGLVPHVIEDRARDADTARFRQAFQARGDVHAVAVDVVTLDHDVAQVHADTQVDAAFGGRLGVSHGHGALDVDGADHGVDHAGEVHQGPVAHEFHDTAIVGGDLGIEEVFAQAFERG
jgi:hypothetical protein